MKKLNTLTFKKQYKIFNIFGCPQCGSSKYSVRNRKDVYNVCCKECDYSPDESVLIAVPWEPKTPAEQLKFLRILFQEWNDGICRYRGQGKRRVMTRTIKGDEENAV